MADRGRVFERLLVANRGEIATRILQTARELGLTTFACYTDNDISHTYNAAHAIHLSSPSAYNDIDEILRVAKENDVQAIHPGYGFLSESAAFARRMEDAGILVVGPGSRILEETGDKIRARMLAEECAVPVLPALTTPTSSIDAVEDFARQYGLPIMVKAVDGGGGRGIRLIRDTQDLRSLTARAIQESPSKQVFAERAAVDGYRHVEVQIVGDAVGNILHLWERECSIQRRFQKVVELAPSTLSRTIVQPLVEAAVKMANKIHYRSLGTFEFLVHPSSGEYFFLEINPRLQVEHTITETICNLDIVAIQLRISMGSTFDVLGLNTLTQSALKPPGLHAVQLRIAAEDPERNWSLCSGKISSFRWPQGNGTRVDSALIANISYAVSPDFDSVIAKVIISANSWESTVEKARRALEDIEIGGIRTNIDVLRAIIASTDFARALCDTQWLEKQQDVLIQQSRSIANSRKNPLHGLTPTQSYGPAPVSISSSTTLFRRDDAWSIALTPATPQTDAETQDHHLRLDKVLRNDFPTSLRAQLTWTSPGVEPKDYMIDLKATAASAAAVGAQHRKGDPRNSSHVVTPFAGKLIEISVEEGDAVKMGDCIAVVQQMKMELEVRAQCDGIITWLCNVEDGEDIAEGILLAIIDESSTSKPKL